MVCIVCNKKKSHCDCHRVHHDDIFFFHKSAAIFDCSPMWEEHSTLALWGQAKVKKFHLKKQMLLFTVAECYPS